MATHPSAEPGAAIAIELGGSLYDERKRSESIVVVAAGRRARRAADRVADGGDDAVVDVDELHRLRDSDASLRHGDGGGLLGRHHLVRSAKSLLGRLLLQ